MNKRIDLSNLAGFPLTQERLAFMQDSYREAFKGIAKLCGDLTILTGVEIVGPNVTAGWISYNGELVPFLAGTAGADVVVEETSVSLLFEDGVSRPVLFTKVAYCGSPATFAFADLKPLNTLQQMWLPGDVKEVDCTDAYIVANFDGTGLGIGERKGWAICNGSNGTRDRRGRFPIGWDDRTVDPSNGWWDLLYNTMGATAGSKAVVLTSGNLPTLASSNHHLVNRSGVNTFTGGDSSAGEYDLQTSIAWPGADTPHENRPPFIVTLFIQKL